MKDHDNAVETQLLKRNNRFSLIAFWLIVIMVIGANAKYHHWENPNKIIYVDVLHYYAYLPATFIQHDLTLEFLRTTKLPENKFFWPQVLPDNRLIILTTMGMSYMYAPFFLAVHYPLKWLGFRAMGYSPPYKVALIVSCIFWFSLGLFFLRKLLLKYFSDLTTAISLIAIVLATNLFYYVTDEPAMSHGYSFALFSLFLYFTDRWSGESKIKYAFALGLLAGAIALIRPTNTVIVILLLLWGVDSFKALTGKIKFFLKNYTHVLIMIVAAILVWVPQVIYWKYMTGQYFVFTYGEKGKFFFDNPQLFRVLLGFRKGWLIYTPVMIFSIIGLIPLWKSYRKLFWAVIFFMVVNIWIVSSWWLWWYGGSYGMRALIESYALMAIPLAAFLAWLTEKRSFSVKVFTSLLILAFVVHNFFQISQYHTGAVDAIRQTKESYFSTFMKLRPNARQKKLLVYPDYKAAAFGKYPRPSFTDSLYTGLLDRNQAIRKIEQEIRSGEESMKMMQQKAVARNISIDSAINLDAIYLYKLKVEKGEIPVNQRKIRIFDWWY
jgi:hypothetical protein